MLKYQTKHQKDRVCVCVYVYLDILEGNRFLSMEFYLLLNGLKKVPQTWRVLTCHK